MKVRSHQGMLEVGGKIVFSRNGVPAGPGFGA